MNNYEKIEQAIRPHLEHYGEPWERRKQLILDIIYAIIPNKLTLGTGRESPDWRKEEIKRFKEDSEMKSLKQREQLASYNVDHGVDIIGDERD